MRNREESICVKEVSSGRYKSTNRLLTQRGLAPKKNREAAEVVASAPPNTVRLVRYNKLR